MTTSLTRKKTDNPLILNAVNSYLRKRLHSQVTPFKKKHTVDTGMFSAPKLLHFFRQQDENNRLLSEIKKLVHDDINPRDILVVTTSVTCKRSLQDLIQSTLKIPCEAINDENKNRHSGHLGLCTLSFLERHALTSPYQFITGLNLLVASEAQFHNEPEKEKNLIEKNSRQLAMSMMRAQKQLTLLITADEIPTEFVSPEFEIPTINSKSIAEVRYLHG